MAGAGVRIDWHDGAAVLTLGNPPSNALTTAVRKEFLAALDLVRDADCIVLIGAGAGFSSALPIDPDPALPSVAQLCAAVETAGVPVVAALHGVVMGSGGELALAATARIAAPDLRLALPLVALGLCPEGGTTRRLPCLVGAEAALDLLISGRAIALEEGLDLGLIDQRADGTLLAAALDLAGRLARGQHLPRGEVDPTAWTKAVARARRTHAGALPAVGRIIGCVEAALLLPPEAAQAYETVAREDLEASPEVLALRWAVRAERRAATLPPALAKLRPDPVARIGLAGAHPALAVIAQAALGRGLGVTWAFPTPQDRAAGLATLEAGLAADLRRGQLTAATRDAARALLTVTEDPLALAGLPVQALASVPGREPPAPPEAARMVLDGPPGSLGLAIAPSGRACELALPAEEGLASVATAIATLRRIGLPPVLVGGRPVLGARCVQAGDKALGWLVAQGVPSRALAQAFGGFGATLPTLPAPNPALPTPAPPRDMAAEDILRRWLAALANEGLRLLESGIARRPSDIDHALVAGHFFPRWRGGPMFQADARGLMVLRHDLRIWAEEDDIWTPAPLMDRLIGRGLRLSALDG